MKVIDLLNKIANGEYVPKKVKYENRILYLEDENEEYEPTFNYYDKDGENALFEGWIGQYLNDEVEIIENKKIEKLEDYDFDDDFDVNTKCECLRERMFEIAKKVNEIIDHINNGDDE